MGSPDLDKRLADYLGEREAEQRLGVSLGTLHKAVTTLADSLAEHVKDDAKKWEQNDDRWRRWREKWRHFSETGVRQPMRSLTGEDSGSWEVGAFGARAKFSGKWPMMIGAVVLMMCAAGFVGAVAHSAFAHGNVAQGQSAK